MSDNSGAVDIAEGRLFATEIFGYVATTLSVVLCTLLVHVVRCHSPSYVGAYKWYIASNAILSTSYSVVYVLTQPEPLQYNCVAFGGIFKNRTLPPVYARIAANVTMFLWLGMHHTTLLMFLFRYAQTSQNWLLGWLSRFRTAIPFGSVLYFTAAAVGILPTNLELRSFAEIGAQLSSVDPEFYERLRGKTFIGLPTPDSPYFNGVLAGGCFVLVLLVTGIGTCTFGCYRSLEKCRASLSTRTIRLYHVLLKALIVEQIVCSLFTMFPCLIITVTFWLQLERASSISFFAMAVTNLHSIASHLVCLLYIQPYRKACLRYFHMLPSAKVSEMSTVHIYMHK